MKPLPASFLTGRPKIVGSPRLYDYYRSYPFSALRKARNMTAEGIVAELLASGLRGRGGASFPVGLKWQSVMQQAETVRYVVANGEEGEPGTYKDRVLLEQNPLAVIEALVIAGCTVKAERGYIYLNQNYRAIEKALLQLLQWLREEGRLRCVEGAGAFDIQVRRGRQRYISGEETALFRALEGRRAEPTGRPPYPTEQGLWGKPTVINNIETLASVSLIIERGDSWFAAIGPEHNHGPKLFSLSGDVARPDVIEADMSATLADLIGWAGGTVGTFKGAFVSGPSGRLFLPRDLSLPLTIQNGCGNGTVIVFNDTRCAVDLARQVTDFFHSEHCGQCLPGRESMKQAKALMDGLENQAALEPVLQHYQQLHAVLLNSSKCGLCSSGTGIVPALMQAFPADFARHLRHDCPICRAGAEVAA